jgi:hypothetical protein
MGKKNISQRLLVACNASRDGDLTREIRVTRIPRVKYARGNDDQGIHAFVTTTRMLRSPFAWKANNVMVFLADLGVFNRFK